ncbi:MAG: biotin--[acetyl-CoA-carboxylase] ligase [Victivallales bacterium]|nr:biotin--[acetyl-CoA-carboxylase] ligase [Victivallales bacterium]
MFDLEAASRFLNLPEGVFSLNALESCGSTNQVALDAANIGAPEGLVVVAEHQTAGRGRQRRLWHSPPGKNLAFSLLLRPHVPQTRFPQLTMLAAIGLRLAIREVAPELKIDLKWPNDLWHQGKKLSGILCECPPQTGSEDTPAIVIGIGLNVNTLRDDFPHELQATATSLAIAAEKTFSRERILAEFLVKYRKLYLKWLNTNDLCEFLPIWAQDDLLLGKTITVLRPTDQITGKVLGLTSEGLLRLNVAGREVVVTAGDIHLAPVTPCAPGERPRIFPESLI